MHGLWRQESSGNHRVSSAFLRARRANHRVYGRRGVELPPTHHVLSWRARDFLAEMSSSPGVEEDSRREWAPLLSWYQVVSPSDLRVWPWQRSTTRFGVAQPASRPGG